MKAIVKTKKEPGIDVKDVARPEVGEADILVKVAAASLCGSDVHVYEWTPSYEWLPVPVILGHGFSGTVTEVGSKVDMVKVGDRITALPSMSCSRCSRCQVGQGEACANKRTLGLSTDGAFAEYVRLSAAAKIFKLPENVSNEAAALCEPLAVAMHAVDISGIKPGHRAAILGPGPIGLLTLQALRVAGASLVVVAGTSADAKRLQLASTLGADAIINVDEADPVAMTQALTKGDGGKGLDFVFEATGNPRSVPQALSMIKRGGKVILIGIHPAPAQFHPTDLVRSGKSIVGAYGYEAETWQRGLALLATGRLQVEPMITHRVPIAEAKEGFELAVRKEAAKVLFIP